jgi:endogenous inhibitor of DNA gyrase (YacG/DUF329 family)
MSGSMRKTCAICAKPRETEAFRPFCSKRCADVDLQRWLSGGYVVPGQSPEEGGPPVFSPDEEG